MPWQQYVDDVALELDSDGKLWYRTIVIVVPRQSGKTTKILAKTVWRLSVYAAYAGPQLSTYTAQKRKDARKRFERKFAPEIRMAPRFFPEVNHSRMRPRKPNEWRLSLNNGAECIQFGDSYWQVEGVDDESGHGDTLDDGTIDEARFLRTNGIEAAMSPAQITRTDAQIWIISSAGDEGSPFLWSKVKAGRAACESGEHGRTAYFEWSAPDDADAGDPEVWRACMPALGHTIDEERIAMEWDKARNGDQDDIDTFKQEYLGIWVTTPPEQDEDAGWILPKANYLDATDPRSKIKATPRLALAVSPDRQWSSLAAAGESNRGGTHAGVLRYAEGTGWVADEIKQWGKEVAVAKDSPAMALVDDLKAAGIKVVEFTTQEQGQAFGQLFDLVASGEFWHPEQSHLDLSVKCAELRLTEGGVSLLSPKRSSIDISPLVAVTLAVGMAQRPKIDSEAVVVWS